MTSSIKEQKNALRQWARERAKTLDSDYRRAADRAILEAVSGWEVWQRAERVFVYVSVRQEPDTRALIETALAAGKRVYVPLCGTDRTMKAVRIQSLAELRPGTLNIPEPQDGGETAAPGELDLVVAPCLSADRSGGRLGHGAGYYDRFLAGCTCPVLCLCHERLLADAVPMDTNDVRMTALATEQGIFNFQ